MFTLDSEGGFMGYLYARSYDIVHVKHMSFTVWQLHLNQVDQKTKQKKRSVIYTLHLTAYKLLENTHRTQNSFPLEWHKNWANGDLRERGLLFTYFPIQLSDTVMHPLGAKNSY